MIFSFFCSAHRASCMPCSHLLKFQFLEVALWGDFSISHKIPSLISDFEWIVMLRCNYLLKSNFRLCHICLSKMIFSFFCSAHRASCLPFSHLLKSQFYKKFSVFSLQAKTEKQKFSVFRFPFSVIYNNLLKTSLFCCCIYRRLCINLRYESSD